LKKKGPYERTRPRPLKLGLEESRVVVGCSFNCHYTRNNQQSRMKDGQGSASLEERSTRRDIVTWHAWGSTIPLHKYMSYSNAILVNLYPSLDLWAWEFVGKTVEWPADCPAPPKADGKASGCLPEHDRPKIFLTT